MADKPDGELIDDVEQGRQIENVLDEAVHCAGRPGAVPVASQIERIYVVMFAQRAGDPVPVARVIQAAVNQHERRLSVLSVIPELQLQPVGVEEMRNWFHRVQATPRRSRSEFQARLYHSRLPGGLSSAGWGTAHLFRGCHILVKGCFPGFSLRSKRVC